MSSSISVVATAVASIFTVPSWLVRSRPARSARHFADFPLKAARNLSVTLRFNCDDDCHATSAVSRTELIFEQSDSFEELNPEADFLVLWIDDEGNYHVGSVPNIATKDLLEIQHSVIAENDDDLRQLLELMARKYPGSSYIIYLDEYGRWRIWFLIDCHESLQPECRSDVIADQQFQPTAAYNDSEGDEDATDNEEDEKNQQASGGEESNENKSGSNSDNESGYSSAPSPSGGGSVRPPLTEITNRKRTMDDPAQDMPSVKKSIHRVDADDGEVLLLTDTEYKDYIEAQRQKYQRQKEMEDFRSMNDGVVLDDFIGRQQPEKLARLNQLDSVHYIRQVRSHKDTSMAKVIWEDRKGKKYLRVVDLEQYEQHVARKIWLKKIRSEDDYELTSGGGRFSQSMTGQDEPLKGMSFKRYLTDIPPSDQQGALPGRVLRRLPTDINGLDLDDGFGLEEISDQQKEDEWDEEWDGKLSTG